MSRWRKPPGPAPTNNPALVGARCIRTMRQWCRAVKVMDPNVIALY